MMKSFIILFFVMTVHMAFGQDKNRLNFIGISPGITVEPYYNSGEFDINVLPIVYQRSISNRMDLRLASTVNYGIRNGNDKLSHIGLELGAPLFLKKKENSAELSKGFFIAPVLSAARNYEAHHTNIGTWIEPGYNMLFEDRWALSLGLQFGGTYFLNDNSDNEWGNHFGVIVIFGKWF